MGVLTPSLVYQFSDINICTYTYLVGIRCSTKTDNECKDTQIRSEVLCMHVVMTARNGRATGR